MQLFTGFSKFWDKDSVVGIFYLRLKNFIIFVLQEDECLLNCFSAINKWELFLWTLTFYFFQKFIPDSNYCEK